MKARLPGAPKPGPLPCLLPSAPDLSLPLAPPACCRHAHQTLWLRPEGADGAPGRQATRHRPPAGDLSLRDGEQKRPAHLPAQPSVSHRCIPQSSSQMGTVGECSAWSVCLRPLLCCSAVLCYAVLCTAADCDDWGWHHRPGGGAGERRRRHVCGIWRCVQIGLLVGLGLEDRGRANLCQPWDVEQNATATHGWVLVPCPCPGAPSLPCLQEW